MSDESGEAAERRERELERVWWRHVPRTITDPVTVFRAMRDESPEAVGARQEPVLAIVLLAGVATVLETSVAGELLDDPEIDGWLIAVWAIIGGVVYGIVSYWLGAAAIYLGARGASAKDQQKATYQRARHVLGYAVVPIALSLVLWPVRVAIWGTDIFRTGGSDTGAGPAVFDGIAYACVAWAFALLVVGVRTTYHWTWVRALGTMLLGLMALTCIVLAFYLV